MLEINSKVICYRLALNTLIKPMVEEEQDGEK